MYVVILLISGVFMLVISAVGIMLSLAYSAMKIALIAFACYLIYKVIRGEVITDPEELKAWREERKRRNEERKL